MGLSAIFPAKTMNFMGDKNPNIVFGPSGLGFIPVNASMPGATGGFDWGSLINRGFDLGSMIIRQNPPAGTYQQNTPYGSTIVRAQDGQPINFAAAQGGLQENVGASLFGNMGVGTIAMILGGVLLVALLMKK